MKQYKPIINGVLAVIGALLAYKLYKGIKSGATTVNEIISDIKTDAQVQQLDGAFKDNQIGNANAAAVYAVAEKIYKALYKNDWFGFSEDEDAAIKAFNLLVSVAEVKACAAVYEANYGKDLGKDLHRCLNGLQLDELKVYLWNAINPFKN